MKETTAREGKWFSPRKCLRTNQCERMEGEDYGTL